MMWLLLLLLLFINRQLFLIWSKMDCIEEKLEKTMWKCDRLDRIFTVLEKIDNKLKQ